MNSIVNIKVDKRNGRTILRSAFYTTPYKILDVTEDKSSAYLQLMLMSTSPGILDDDDIKMHINLAPFCQLRLLTQAYQRIFDMQTGAFQKMEVHLAEHTSFIYLPHPTVPQQRSIFRIENIFHLHPTARLLYGEVITCGRKHSGSLSSLPVFNPSPKFTLMVSW